MTATLTLFVVCCSSAFAQMDTTTLRTKYGEPLARETFQVRPNIEAVMNYGTSHQVCRIDLPPGSYMNIVGEIPPHFATKQQVDEVIDELVPPSVRGKEIGTGALSLSRASVRLIGYDHLDIAEPQDPDHPGQRTGVTITFKRPDCH
jgi:hypothetical protein